MISSCKKDKTEISNVPEIRLVEVTPAQIKEYKDKVVFNVYYKDGDGDIGVSESDTTKTFWYTYYYKDTVTQLFRAYYSTDINDTLRTGYIIKAPDDSYKGKTNKR